MKHSPSDGRRRPWRLTDTKATKSAPSKRNHSPKGQTSLVEGLRRRTIPVGLRIRATCGLFNSYAGSIPGYGREEFWRLETISAAAENSERLGTKLVAGRKISSKIWKNAGGSLDAKRSLDAGRTVTTPGEQSQRREVLTPGELLVADWSGMGFYFLWKSSYFLSQPGVYRNPRQW